jgi:hypothetical protein
MCPDKISTQSVALYKGACWNQIIAWFSVQEMQAALEQLESPAFVSPNLQ